MSDPAIVLYPDPRLARPAAPVADFGPTLEDAAARLLRALDTAPAIGLAGPHIDLPLRLVAVRLPGEALGRVYVNPEIVWRSEALATHAEGSVSLPGVAAPVERPASVRVRFLDLEGRPQDEAAEGFAAAVLQHEIDQLDGVFFLERLSKLRRDRILKSLGKRRR